MDKLELGKNAKLLLSKYAECLGITFEQSVFIINKNKTAQSLLKEELALGITSINENLSALMSITILREFNDFEPIRQKEKQLVYEYYGLILDNLVTNKHKTIPLTEEKKNFLKERMGINKTKIDFNKIKEEWKYHYE